jgi:hypothetical protein
VAIFAQNIFKAAAFLGLAVSNIAAQNISVDWNKVERISNITPTLQVVVNPPLRRGAAIHDRVFSELKQLGADYVRYVPWLPYPRLGVAELAPPTATTTSWDFSLIDPMTVDFLECHEGAPRHNELQHYPAMDVCHAAAGDLSDRSRPGLLEVHARNGTA